MAQRPPVGLAWGVGLIDGPHFVVGAATGRSGEPHDKATTANTVIPVIKARRVFIQHLLMAAKSIRKFRRKIQSTRKICAPPERIEKRAMAESDSEKSGAISWPTDL